MVTDRPKTKDNVIDFVKAKQKLQNVKYFVRGLEIKHKSTNDIQIKIDKVTDYEFICMSHDVY